MVLVNRNLKRPPRTDAMPRAHTAETKIGSVSQKQKQKSYDPNCRLLGRDLPKSELAHVTIAIDAAKTQTQTAENLWRMPRYTEMERVRTIRNVVHQCKYGFSPRGFPLWRCDATRRDGHEGFVVGWCAPKAES